MYLYLHTHTHTHTHTHIFLTTHAHTHFNTGQSILPTCLDSWAFQKQLNSRWPLTFLANNFCGISSYDTRASMKRSYAALMVSVNQAVSRLGRLVGGLSPRKPVFESGLISDGICGRSGTGTGFSPSSSVSLSISFHRGSSYSYKTCMMNKPAGGCSSETVSSHPYEQPGDRSRSNGLNLVAGAADD
jgi:hypothetical protein